MNDFSYFCGLTPRQQLNDLVHKIAQGQNISYQAAWSVLDKAWEHENGKTLSLFRAISQKRLNKKITLPEYVEMANLMDPVLELLHRLNNNIVINWMNEHTESEPYNQK